MKLSEFKQEMYQRLQIFKASCLFAFRKEVAYSGNNWARIISTTAYTFSMLLFVDIIFANTKEIAGYSHNEMLLYFFLGQLTYYTNWSFSMNNLYDLIADVNKGNLDMVLMRPVPALFYLTTRNLGGFNMVADGLPPTLAIIVAIDWVSLNLNPTNVIYGLFIFIFGSIALHVFQFLAAIPVFWLGESENIVDLAGFIGAGSGSMIPLEGFSKAFQITFSTIIPVLIVTAFSASAMLGKTNSQYLFIWSFIIAVSSIAIRNIAWKFAIKNYTSASS